VKGKLEIAGKLLKAAGEVWTVIADAPFGLLPKLANLRDDVQDPQPARPSHLETPALSRSRARRGDLCRTRDLCKAVPAMRRVAKLISFPIDERKRAADLTIKVPRTWGSGLDVHTLEPIKLRQLQIAAGSAHKKIHRKKSLSRTTAKRYLGSSHEHIRFAESLEKRR